MLLRVSSKQSNKSKPSLLKQARLFLCPNGGDNVDSLYREAVQKKVEKKFKGKEALQAKQKPNKPVSAEREYIRLAHLL